MNCRPHLILQSYSFFFPFNRSIFVIIIQFWRIDESNLFGINRFFESKKEILLIKSKFPFLYQNIKNLYNNHALSENYPSSFLKRYEIFKLKEN